VPAPSAVSKVKEIYAALLAEESKHSDKRAGIAAGVGLLTRVLAEKKMDYDEFVFSL
jgi:hypothetical protein